jgi:predicted O-methyltransferase YrrM
MANISFLTSSNIRILLLYFLLISTACAQSRTETTPIDEQVFEFLEKSRGNWRDMNVPYQDGKVLYDLILKNNYTSALEIGTSTGHSTVWIAWAMSKTGGKVITIEINESRHREALENLREAGLEEYVDARLADAHQLVKELEGPFDFVFSDADKGWYTRYFKDVDGKLKTGGCFTAHNVSNNYGGAREFVDYVRSLDNYETTIDHSSRSGISISYKKSE